MRGVKNKIRGRVHAYASRRRYSTEDEAGMTNNYGIKDVACDDLPRGVLVGTVEIHGRNGEDWHVRKPVRAKKRLKPKKQPQPRPFSGGTLRAPRNTKVKINDEKLPPQVPVERGLRGGQKVIISHFTDKAKRNVPVGCLLPRTSTKRFRLALPPRDNALTRSTGRTDRF
jgi:hypothetical protein